MDFRTALRMLILCIPLQLITTEEWTRHTVLDKDGRYHLYWNPPADKEVNGEILFKVEVRTKGYVGFGLSYNGGMTGSDIVTGWVKDGQPYFQDRHGIGNTLPRLDRNQNWILKEAHENETHTTLQFRRKLNTCDEEDMVIDDSTMRVIYAFSEQDPMADSPSYHHSNRGVKSVHLLQAPPKPQIIEDPSLLHWDVRSPKIDISSNETLYWSKIFKTPSVLKKNHIVRVEPLIQEGNEPLVHHMTFSECVGTSEEYEPYVDSRGYDENQPNFPDAFKKCRNLVLGWVPGGEDTVYPESAGLPLKSDMYYRLGMHYNNPQRTQGVIDESGLRIYYTPNLRKYDIGLISFGSTLSPTMFIPPGQETYVVSAYSDPDCLRPGMPAEGLRVIATALHAHMIGRRITARHFRGNKELPPIAVENNYDFQYQEHRYFKEEVTVLTDDVITVECTYDSSRRTTVTLGGLASSDEMCVLTLIYYPRINRIRSWSVPTISTINRLLKTSFTDESSAYSLREYNWTNVDMRELQNGLKYSEHSSECTFTNGQTVTMKNSVSFPRNFKPFVPTDTTCNEDFPESVSSRKAFSPKEEFSPKEAFSSSKAFRVDDFCLFLAFALSASHISQSLFWG